MPIAEKLIRKVEIRLGGADWPLVVTHDVLIECERLTGQKMLAGGEALRPTARLVRALLYLMLRRAGAKYTPGSLNWLMAPQNADRVYRTIINAWNASMPDQKPDAGGPAIAPKPFDAIEAWALARYDLGLSDQEWLDSTPRQIDELIKRRNLRRQFEETLMAVIAASAANAPHWRSPNQREALEFITQYPFAPKPPRRITGEVVSAAFAHIPKGRKVNWDEVHKQIHG